MLRIALTLRGFATCDLTEALGLQERAALAAARGSLAMTSALPKTIGKQSQSEKWLAQ